MRFADHAVEISAVEMRVLVRKDVGLNVAEGCFGLVLDAFIEGLDDVVLEMRRAVNTFTMASRSATEYSIGQAKTSTSTPAVNSATTGSCVWNARRRVQCDRRPRRVDIRLGDPVPFQKIPRRIRAVDLEAFIVAAMGLGQTHVVEHSSRIEQFRIDFRPRCSPASAPNR